MSKPFVERIYYEANHRPSVYDDGHWCVEVQTKRGLRSFSNRTRAVAIACALKVFPRLEWSETAMRQIEEAVLRDVTATP